MRHPYGHPRDEAPDKHTEIGGIARRIALASGGRYTHLRRLAPLVDDDQAWASGARWMARPVNRKTRSRMERAAHV